MTKIITTIAIIVISGFYCLFLSHRNNKVFYFRIEICIKCHNVILSFFKNLKDDNEFAEKHYQYEMLKEKADKIINKYSYNSMMFSLKPLKLESWFTEEEIDFMNLRQKGE